MAADEAMRQMEENFKNPLWRFGFSMGLGKPDWDALKEWLSTRSRQEEE